MFYIRIKTTNGCVNLGLFVSLYEKVENGEHRYLLVCGDQTYDCNNIKSIMTPTHFVDFRADEMANDKTGSVRFTSILSMLPPI